MSQASRLDEAPGRIEQRTKPYSTYGEGVAEILTPRFAKNAGSAAGSASGQAGVAGGLW